MFKRVGISWLEFWLPMAAALVLVLGVCGALYWREADQIKSNMLDRDLRRTEIFSGLFASDISSALTDLRLLASGDGLQAYLLSGQPADLGRAVKRAQFFSEENPDYDKVRFLDESGQEVIRINRGGVVVPNDQLQNKTDRPFFQKPQQLRPGEIYLSALDLNMEHGEIEEPYKPTLRLAMPVFDEKGQRRGVYVINYQVMNSIERLRQLVPAYQQRLRLLNAQGYWLTASKPEEEWGFMLPGRADKTMARTNPELWARIVKEPEGQVPFGDGYFSWFHSVPRDFAKGKPVTLVTGDDFLVFASEISPEEWAAAFAQLRQTFVMVAALLLILSLAITWFFQARRKAQLERDRFFDLTRDMLCVAGFDGYFKRVNPAWEKALGYTLEEMVAIPFVDFVHPEERAKTIAETRSLAKGGEVISFENRYRCKDGSYRWLLWSARSLVQEQLIYGSARDLTERKQMEERLRQNEERTRLMLESVKDYAIVMLDPGGRVVSWNTGAERINGYRVEEIIGEHLSRFYSTEKIREGFPDKELQEAAEKGRFEDEGWRVRKDGTLFWANVVISAVRNTQGELIGFVKVSRDISERRKAEEALRLSEERSRSIIEGAHDGFISIDIDGRITEWNLQSEMIFGWSRAEALGRFLHETIIPVKYRESHLRGIRHLKATGEGPVLNKTIELSGLRRNGDEFPLELVIWPLQMGEEKTFHAFVRDITSRKEAAEREQKLHEELKQRADLLEAANKELESFSYSVSHDLRAPLRHIHGFVDLLQKVPALEGDESSHRYMSVIARAAKEMGQLIDDLLAFSRTSRAEMHPGKVDMAAMVEQVIGDLDLECRGRVVKWEVKALPEVGGDPALLRLVWTNLLGNAVKYTKPRAEARIEIGEAAREGEAAARGEVVFYVRDNGVGFDMRYAEKLFGVFQRLHRAEDFEGTGIGLANVQRIILRHGGRVWAEGQVDSGATFYFSLPAAGNSNCGS